MDTHMNPRPTNLAGNDALEHEAQDGADGNAGSDSRDRPAELSRLQDCRPDIPAIMASIRAQMKGALSGKRDERAPLQSFEANTEANASRRAAELVYSEERLYLNNHYNFSTRLDLDSITSHRPGI